MSATESRRRFHDKRAHRVWVVLAIAPVCLAFVVSGDLANAGRDESEDKLVFLTTFAEEEPVVPAGQRSGAVPPSSGTAPRAASSAETLSDAERIGRLQQSIENSGKRLEEIHTKLLESDREFEQAGDAFRLLDEQLEEKRQTASRPESTDAPQAQEELHREIAELENKWQLARERFDLSIELRKTLQEEVRTLQLNLEQERKALDRLLNPPKTDENAPLPEPAPDHGKAASADAAASPPAKEGAAATAVPLPTLGTTPPAPAVEPGETPPASEKKPPSPELIAAGEEAARTDAAAKAAEQEVAAIKSRLEALEQRIALEQQAREAARRQADNADEVERSVSAELQRKLIEGAPEAELRQLRSQIQDAQNRSRIARNEVRQRAQQADRLQADRAALLSEQLVVAKRAEEERQKADRAKDRVEAIQNPFTLRNIAQWFLDHGPQLLLVVVAVLILQLFIKFVGQRIVAAMTRSDNRGTRRERENRAKTLVSVFENAAFVALYVGSALMILDIVGIPIGPLLGGAAVIGLAIAFGAQNLIKDYFYGFMILLENQYGVNDVVAIGGITGFVERITLRVTVLRDLDAVHFIPHGQITTVSNLTHKWSRAVFDISIAYKEDADAVMALLFELGRKLREDPEFGPMLLDDPEMLGVDALGDSAVVIKFFIKTLPTKQWPVKRELLRRIKKEFDARGIEIPFPHRTVYHRYENGADLAGR